MRLLRASAAVLAGALFLGCPGGPGGGGDEPDPAGLGEPCESHGQCESGLCLTEAGPAVCGQPCEDEDDCPPGESCRFVSARAGDGDMPEAGPPELDVLTACRESNDGGRLLADACEEDDDCLTGLCLDGACRELCTECGLGEVCEPATLERLGETLSASVCFLDPAAPALELGPVSVTEDGSEDISVEIPDGLASFTIVAEQDAVDSVQRVTILSLLAPDGTVLVDFENEEQDLNPSAIPYPGATTVIVPSTDDTSLRPEAGTYTLRVGLYETDFVEFFPAAGVVDRVSVILEPAGDEGGLLDLNLFFSPATGVTAEDARTSDFVQNMLDQLFSYLEPGGLIRRGRVAYRNVPEEHDDVEDGDEAREMCRVLSRPGPNRVSLNVFVVGSLPGMSGIAGGAPGPPGVVGTAASCIVVERRGGGGRTGLNLGHEVGHFLGLHHTTRVAIVDGSYQVIGDDGIGDTPRCQPGTNTRDCPDYHNIMFYAIDEETLGQTFSPGQLTVMARNPMLYEIDRPRICPPSVSTYDATRFGFAAGDSTALDDAMRASCGGAGAPDRTHLYQLETDGLEALEVTVHGQGFAPVVSVFSGDCDASSAEVACETGEADTDLVATVPNPEPGWYFIVVDGADETGGPFSLSVAEL